MRLNKVLMVLSSTYTYDDDDDDDEDIVAVGLVVIPMLVSSIRICPINLIKSLADLHASKIYGELPPVVISSESVHQTYRCGPLFLFFALSLLLKEWI